MSQTCKYVAIDGTVLKFGYDGKLFLGEGNIREYLYSPYSPYGKILGFDDEDIKQYSIPLYISASMDESAELRNKVFEIFEKDVLYKNNNPCTQKSGRLYIGEYYLNCFVNGSAPSGYLQTHKILKKQLTITTDSPKWIKEVEFLFISLDESTGSKKYPYKYPFSYIPIIAGQQLLNTYMLPANFNFVIQPKENAIVTNPYIIIDDNHYQFNVTLHENEKLIVNSAQSSIVLVDAAGNQSDALYTRDKSNDIFKKTPVGENPVSISSNTKVYLTLLFERSEPEWI